MATLSNAYLTLADWADRQKPTGGVSEIIEVMASSNPIIADANVMEGNLPTGHRSVQRTSEPAGTWRLLNQGVAAEKSTTETVTDLCGILEDYSRLDVDVALLNGDSASFRASEDNAFVAGLSGTVATALFYGNQALNPEQIQGLAPRYNGLTSTPYDDQIINGGAAGGQTDCTSIWLVTWGPKTCSLIYPKSSKAGLQSEDLGKQLITDSNNLMYQAYVTRFQWKLGLALMDYRYVIRIANIDSSLLTSDAATGADLLDKMLDAYYARPSVDLGKMAKTFWYCNKTVAKFLHKQAQNKNNVNLTLDNPAGKPVVSFLDASIRVCDKITNAEDALT